MSKSGIDPHLPGQIHWRQITQDEWKALKAKSPGIPSCIKVEEDANEAPSWWDFFKSPKREEPIVCVLYQGDKPVTLA